MFKDFSHTFVRNLLVENSTSDVMAIWPKGEEVIFDATRDTAYVSMCNQMVTSEIRE